MGPEHPVARGQLGGRRDERTLELDRLADLQSLQLGVAFADDLVERRRRRGRLVTASQAQRFAHGGDAHEASRFVDIPTLVDASTEFPPTTEMPCSVL